MDIPKHPHDEFFRLYFKRPELLASLLEFSLPPELTATLDLTTLEVEEGTHIDEHLREHLSDLAATVELAGRSDDATTGAASASAATANDATASAASASAATASAKVYILVEHKSYKDPWALLQLLRYMVQIWSEQRKAKPAEPLMPIIPLVVYHGTPRTVGRSFAELFPGDLPEPLRAYIPRFAAELLNLTALPDAEIPQAPAPLSAALWAMKYARTQTEKTLAALDRLAATVGKALVEQQGFDILKLYIVQASPYEPSEFIDMVNRVLQTAMLREEAVGTAEKLIEQGKREGLREGIRRGVDRGRQEGRQEGKREGLQEGLQEGKREGLQEGLEKGRQVGVQEQREHTARELLARGLSAAEIAQVTGLSEGEVRALAEQSQT